MDEQGNGQLSSMGGVHLPSSYASNPYQTDSIATADAASAGAMTASTPQSSAYHQMHHHQQQQQLNQELQSLWTNQFKEIEETTDFKNHSVPLARIKKIMKADEDVRMISAEAPAVFARACEMFIQELTIRAWSHTEENKRRTLQKNDIVAAVMRTDIYDFLLDVFPREYLRDEVLGAVPRGSTVPEASYRFGYLDPGDDTLVLNQAGVMMVNPGGGAYLPKSYFGEPIWLHQGSEEL